MAIIDGGIDVSLPGLQKTSTGLPKIIDCFEFTGNGSVDTSTIKKLDENNSLIGLSGRELKIPLKWKNPSGEWHLGIKSLFKLFQTFDFDQVHERKLIKYVLPKSKMSTMKEKGSILANYQKKNDSEDIFDCIVWNDGKKWCSALITSTNCDNLENVKVLTNFRDGQDYCFLVGKITCCVIISKDGNQLQICSSSEPHGTAVAQIAVSHYPNNSKNKGGLAPGAQIYFMEVMSGPSSSDSEECFVEKALVKCVELGVNIVNISLNFRSISGDVLDNFIIIKSVGNEGPLFCSTNSSKGDEGNVPILYIGSLITSEMNEKINKWKSPNPPSTVLFSSKCPSSKNSSRRVSFVAPGEAIVCSNRWISDTPQFASGTSFAAPNSSGANAFLISALKATSIPYSPALVKFALENTAIPLEDRLASGAGIIQIDSAFEFLKNFSKLDLQIPFPQVFVKDTKLKGITGIVKLNIQIQKHCISLKNANDKENQISWILKLLPESSNSYISYSKTVENGAFEVDIMPESLEPGKMYYAEIQGFHPSPTVIGTFFHLSITLVVPEILTSNTYQKHINIRSNIPSYRTDR